MKTERRHELQTNWLADRLGEAAETSKPYAKGVIGVLVAAVLLLCAYEYLSHRAAAESVAGWNKVWEALNNRSLSERDAALRMVVDEYPSVPAGIWAQLLLADDDLQEGVAVLIDERSVGTNHLHSALKDYQSVEQKTTDPLVRQRALFGVGRAQESLGQLDAARKAFETLTKDYPDGAYAARAQQRLDELASRPTQEFYDWLKYAEPPSRAFGKGDQTPEADKNGGKSEEDLNSLFRPSPSTSKKGSTAPPPEPVPDHGKAEPEKKTSGATKPGEAKSGETKTGATKSGESKSDGNKSDATKSGSNDGSKKKPDEAKSVVPPPAVPPVAPKHDDSPSGAAK